MQSCYILEMNVREDKSEEKKAMSALTLCKSQTTCKTLKRSASETILFGTEQRCRVMFYLRGKIQIYFSLYIDYIYLAIYIYLYIYAHI